MQYIIDLGYDLIALPTSRLSKAEASPQSALGPHRRARCHHPTLSLPQLTEEYYLPTSTKNTQLDSTHLLRCTLHTSSAEMHMKMDPIVYVPLCFCVASFVVMIYLY